MGKCGKMRTCLGFHHEVLESKVLKLGKGHSGGQSLSRICLHRACAATSSVHAVESAYVV